MGEAASAVIKRGSRTVRRCRSTTPGGTEIALFATAALTSATMLLACVVPLPATAANIRAISARAVKAANARDSVASRQQPHRALAAPAKRFVGAQPTSASIATGSLLGGAGAGSHTATGDHGWTAIEPRDCSPARGQPCADALA
jgi:hypothetical protein